MTFREFRQAGHPPTLGAAFLYFDISFMVWVLLGPLGPFIGEALKLTATQKFLLVAVPLLGGSLFRPLLGWMTERYGGRLTGLAGLSATLVPLMIAWLFAQSFGQLLAVGILLGIAGASFAAALPLASAWYPPQYQGIAMGIAGAGNSGTLLATLFAPRLAQTLGWHAVFGLAALPVSAVWLLFFFMAKDAPGQRAVKPWRDYAAVLKLADTGWFCFLYSLTFGGFVGFASSLTIFFRDQYHVSKVQAGDFTTLAVLFGSFLRPVGGMLADKIGGYRLLLALLSGVAICLGAVSALPSLALTLVLFTSIMAMLGMGNGAVFQLVPQRFVGSVGIITGIVGAAGGLGGFLLPYLLGATKDRTGSFTLGLAMCGVAALACAVTLLYLGRVWRMEWTEAAVQRAGLTATPRLELEPEPAPALSPDGGVN